jgi:hypothetical protein
MVSLIYRSIPPDEEIVRAPLAFLATAILASAQSHPAWWTYASPGATALVGIDWQSVRTSPFADPIEAELWGDLGFPELACLHNARQILISSPELLALANGNFPASALRDQAAQKHMKAMTYRGVDMWFATEKGALSLARINDQLLMIGNPETLQTAVDRTITDSKNYSPLLARAAQYAQKDLWVVSSRLPDDLANRFVPLDTEAQSFEGSVSVRNGLELDAGLSIGSEQQANASAEKLRQSVGTFPAIARGLQVTVEDGWVMLGLAASREQVTAALRGPEQVLEAPVETIKVETPKRVEHVAVELPAAPAVVEKSVENIVEKPVEKPQVVRILGLDEGTREIVLPAARPEKQNPE